MERLIGSSVLVAKSMQLLPLAAQDKFVKAVHRSHFLFLHRLLGRQLTTVLLQSLKMEYRVRAQGFPRTTQIRYICNTTATTPAISSVGQVQACQYTIDIQTSSVCNVPISQAVGSTFISDTCGGGAYNLSSISASDISSLVDSNSATLSIDPCGVVRTPSCSGLSNPSVCYVYVNGGGSYLLAEYDPVHAPITYTILPNGLQQTWRDGAYCGNNDNTLRVVNVNYLCSSTATTPVPQASSPTTACTMSLSCPR